MFDAGSARKRNLRSRARYEMLIVSRDKAFTDIIL